MKYFLVLAIFVSGTLTSLAQKEATSRVSNRADNVKVKEITLTTAQQNWLNTNYKQLARLPKDTAATLVRFRIRLAKAGSGDVAEWSKALPC